MNVNRKILSTNCNCNNLYLYSYLPQSKKVTKLKEIKSKITYNTMQFTRLIPKDLPYSIYKSNRVLKKVSCLLMSHVQILQTMVLSVFIIRTSNLNRTDKSFQCYKAVNFYLFNKILSHKKIHPALF